MNIYAQLSEHPAVVTQITRMRDLATDLTADTACVRHHHTSKSINLPVATLAWARWGVEGKLTMMIRDNFHDINLLVQSNSDIALPLDVFYDQSDFAWYQREIDRNRLYSFSDWTDEEIADPRILRVMRKNGNGWSSVRPDEKDRWTARMEDTAWYESDWSSCKLIPVGPVPFTDATVFYRAPFAFAEGIPERASCYTGPCSKFILSLNSWSKLIDVSRVIVAYVKSNAADVANES